MGFFKNLFGGRGRGEAALVTDATQVVFCSAELVETLALKPPPGANGSDDPQPPCSECGKPLVEVLITTGGPLCDPTVWRDTPIAVDGWACVPCGKYRYPRKVTAQRITELMEEGVAHGRAGRFADAEHSFLRVTWNWPGYPPAHINYAEAVRTRLHHAKGEPEALRRKLEARMIEHYEIGIENATDLTGPSASVVPMVSRALVTLAEHALLQARAFDRATRFAKQAIALPGAPPEDVTRAHEIANYIALRLDLFHAAGDVLSPYLDLMGGKKQEIASGDDRKKIADAVSDLAEHLTYAPDRWQSHWLYAKGLFAAERREDGFAAWATAYAKFPASIEIARDYSMDLLRDDRVAESLAVNQAIAARHPDDSSLHCNLGVTQLLVGEIDAAKASIAKARRLDPTDPVAQTVERRLQRGAPFPRKLGELERGG